jgi:protein-S-isoprenylcysteine O-methyltransferase Ste14
MNSLELKVPPVAVFIATGAAMWFAVGFAPALGFHFAGRTLLVAGLLVSGVVTGIAGVVAVRVARTSLNPMQPDKATSLVVSGIFRYSRNPMYVGLALLVTAWAVYLANFIAFLALPGFVAYMSRFQIVPEERALRARFGDRFTNYQRRVRRWL